MIVKQALENYAKANDREFESDRSQTVGASEVGKCARMVYWIKNEGDAYFGADRDEDFEDGWGHKMRGKVFEDDFWFPAMKRHYRERLMYAGPQQRTFRDGYLTATPDGLLTSLTSDERLSVGLPIDYEGMVSMDCKSIDPRSVLHEPKPEHVYQLQVQAGAIMANLSGAKIDYMLISYAEASDWSNVKEFIVKFDPAIYEEAKRRAQRIMTALGPEELDPEGVMSGGGECKYCPFTTACAKMRNARVPEREYKGVSLAQPDKVLLTQLAREIANRKNRIETLEEELGDMQEELRKALVNLNVRNFKEGAVSISWSSVKGRRGWDNKAIREHLTTILGDAGMKKFETEGDPSDRLVVTVKE